MRLIDADAFKEYICNAYEQVKHMYPDGGEWARQITEDFCKDIDDQPTIEPQKWIPCSERLPYAEYGESDNVLATCGHRDVEDGSVRWIKTLYFNGGNWCYPTGETYLEKVYAWMPLPDPWKEEE